MNYRWLLLGGVFLISALGFEGQTLEAQNPFTPAAYNPYAAPLPSGATASSNRRLPNTVITFRVSEVGADKTMLIRLFYAIKAQEEAVKEREGTNLYVSQRISSTEFMVHKMRSSRYPDYAQRFFLKTLTPLNAADGEIINVAVTETTDIQRYTTILGAQKNVRVLTEVPQDTKKVFTEDEFIRRLRDRETWTLKDFEVEDCRVCFGRGELTAFKGGGLCWECTRGGEIGKAYIDYLIRW